MNLNKSWKTAFQYLLLMLKDMNCTDSFPLDEQWSQIIRAWGRHTFVHETSHFLFFSTQSLNSPLSFASSPVINCKMRAHFGEMTTQAFFTFIADRTTDYLLPHPSHPVSTSKICSLSAVRKLFDQLQSKVRILDAAIKGWEHLFILCPSKPSKEAGTWKKSAFRTCNLAPEVHYERLLEYWRTRL